MPIKSRIRTIANFPRAGVMFRDITSLLADPVGFALAIRLLGERYAGMRIDRVAGIEARGFIIGAALALELGTGFVPIRKSGKLPGVTAGCDYQLEYGSDRLEIHVDAVGEGIAVLLVDDLIATGGTATAACRLVEDLGGRIVECAFVVDLPDLGGSARLRGAGHDVFALCAFQGE